MIMKKEKIKKLLLFLIGVFCQTSPMMSRGVMVVYLGFCSLLFLMSINIKKIKVGKGLIWYGLFVLYCMISMAYTINTINPDYVYIRILTYLYLVFLASPFLDEKKNIEQIIKGFLVGGLIGIGVVLIKQHNFIGKRRLGSGVFGSFAEFGAVCSLTMMSFFYLSKEYSQKKVIKVLLFMFIAFGLLLSGARKALLISIMLPILIQLIDRSRKLSKKLIVLLIISLVSLSVIYVSLNNKYLYKFIGYRIESGITAVIGDENEDASLHERGLFKDLAKDMFLLKPIQGWGIHSFAYENYVKNRLLVYSHDGFLEILSCYGIIGFVLFYWPFVYVFINHKLLIFDNIGVYLVAFIIIVLFMEPYSICFFNSSYILMICSTLNIISERRKRSEKSA